jgi:uncharacterized protein YcgI (DUF1989 family)
VKEIRGGGGTAIHLRGGQAVRLVNTHGTQVVDTWCLAADDMTEYLSVEHTRRMLGRLFPKEGDGLYSNRRNILLSIELDSSGCRHDMLVACCDSWLYTFYRCPPGHANCHDNFIEALARHGVRPKHVPNPLNLWMNVPVEANERIDLRPPESKPGDSVLLRAVVNCYVIFSACPMDITPVNGEDRMPKPVHYEIVNRSEFP